MPTGSTYGSDTYGSGTYGPGGGGGGGGGGGSATAFQTPVQDLCPPVSLDPTEIQHNPLGYRLMRHYRTRARGVNVYVYEDGTVHQQQPWEGTVWSFDAVHATVTVTPPAHTAAHTFFGGHLESTDTTTYNAMVAANWGSGQ